MSTTTLAPNAAGAEDLPFARESGLVTGKPKALKYEEIPGLLTKAQVAPHYTAHYGGALKRYVAVEDQLDKLVKGREPLGGDAYAFMEKDKLNRMNSVLLHELYFDNLAARPPEPAGDLRAELAKRFGTLERWQEELGDDQALSVPNPKPKEVDLVGGERPPDKWQPAWIREKYFGPGK